MADERDRLNNSSGIRAKGVTIPVRGKDLGMMEAGLPLGAERPPPNQGELRGQVIHEGINEYRIRCNGIPAGLMERYLFEIIPEYKTWSILNVSARVEYDGAIRVFERRFD